MIRPLVATVASLTLLIAGCGPSTAVREDDDNGIGGTEESETAEFELPDDAMWLAVEVADDVVYTLGQPPDAQMVGSSVRFLAAFDAKDGTKKWQVEFNSPSSLPSYQVDLIHQDDKLIYRSENATMALSPKDGTELWAVDTQNNQTLNVIGMGPKHFYSFAWPNVVYSFSLKDGSQVDSWTLSGYASILEGWMSADGDHVIAKAEPQNSYGEQAVVVLDLKSGAVDELFRHPYGGGERQVVGPRYYSSGSQWNTMVASDHVVVVTTKMERVTLEGWSAVDNEELWTEELQLDPNTMYTSAYYAPRFLLTRSYGMMQEPSSQGVILRNVLRLHLHGLDGLTRQWTNVVPTQHYVDMLLEIDKKRVLIHTRNDTQAERWYLFDAKGGDLIWSSREEEYVGQTRDMATDGSTLARLMTTDWVSARLFVDRIATVKE